MPTCTSTGVMFAFLQASYSSFSIAARGVGDLQLAAAELLEAVARADAADADVDVRRLLGEQLDRRLRDRLDRRRAVDPDRAAQVLADGAAASVPPVLPESFSSSPQAATPNASALVATTTAPNRWSFKVCPPLSVPIAGTTVAGARRRILLPAGARRVKRM